MIIVFSSKDIESYGAVLTDTTRAIKYQQRFPYELVKSVKAHVSGKDKRIIIIVIIIMYQQSNTKQ